MVTVTQTISAKANIASFNSLVYLNSNYDLQPIGDYEGQIGLFELNGNGDLQPISGVILDTFIELDVDNNLRPKLLTTTQVKTVSAKARIKQTSVTKTVSSQARVKQISVTQTVSAKTRAKQTGVTKTSSSKARTKKIDVTKTIQTKSRVKQTSVEKTVSTKSRTKYSSVTKTVSAKARVKKSGNDKTVSAKSNVTNYFIDGFEYPTDGAAQTAYPTSNADLGQCYSESTIKTQGSHSLKFVIPEDEANTQVTFIRTVNPSISASGKGSIRFDIYATRIGSNIQVIVNDLYGGFIVDITPNINQINTWQTVIVDISAINNFYKSHINQIYVVINDSLAANTFYLDNMYLSVLATKTVSAKARSKYIDVTKTISAKARKKIVGNDKTISAKAKVTLVRTETVSAKTRVKNTISQTVSALAKVIYPGVHTWTPLSAKARVKIVGIAKTVSSKTRIFVTQLKTVLSQTRVRKLAITKTVSSKADVKKSGFYATNNIAWSYAAVKNVNTKTSSAKARTKYANVTKTISALAKVLIKYTREKTSSAVARIKVLGNNKTVSSQAHVDFPGTHTWTPLSAKARVKQVRTKTVSSQARAIVTQLKTVLSKSRIQHTTTKTVNTKCRVFKVATITHTKTVSVKTRVWNPIPQKVVEEGIGKVYKKPKVRVVKFEIPVIGTKLFEFTKVYKVVGTIKRILVAGWNLIATKQFSIKKEVIVSATKKIEVISSNILKGSKLISIAVTKQIHGNLKIRVSTLTVLGISSHQVGLSKEIKGSKHFDIKKDFTLKGSKQIKVNKSQDIKGKKSIIHILRALGFFDDED